MTCLTPRITGPASRRSQLAKVRIDSLAMCLAATVIPLRAHATHGAMPLAHSFRSGFLFGNYLDRRNNIARNVLDHVLNFHWRRATHKYV